MLKRILLMLALLVVSILIFAATRPDTYKVQRTGVIAASPTVVFSLIEDFKAWSQWSPWEKMDPKMKKTFDGPPKGVGSHYSWVGNDKVGKGEMTITESVVPSRLRLDLKFIEPFPAEAITSFDVMPVPEGTSVTWSMEGKNTFAGKVFSLFMNMDKAIGGDFERGIEALKAATVSAAKAQAEADAKAAAAAKAEAEAAAKAQSEAAAKAQADAGALPPAAKGKAKSK